MTRKTSFLIAVLICCNLISEAQELNAKVTVLYNQISTTVDRKVFRTLQTGLTNFLNKRKWSADIFEPSEKIQCNILINLQSVIEANVYKATLTVQSGRPVYNTSYLAPVMNFQDDDLTFRYQEFQPLEFNENRVSGTEPLAANLTAVLAYYVNLILALDYDSFSPRGGDPYFQKAINIVNSAPDGRGISGWKPFDGLRNRYWLAENFMNSRYTIIHDVYYTYYRQGLDKFYENESETRDQVINCLNMLNTLNTETPNLMVMSFFFQGKSEEIIKIFKRAGPQDKMRAVELLQRVDITNAAKYKQELK